MLVNLLKSDDNPLLKSDDNPLLHKTQGNMTAEVSESMGIADTDQTQAGLFALSTGNLSLSDTINSIASFLASVDESTQFADTFSVVTLGSLSGDTTDTVTFQSLFATKLSQFAFLSENQSILSSFVAAISGINEVIETYNLSDSYEIKLAMFSELTNDVVLNDTQIAELRKSGLFTSNSVLQDVFSVKQSSIASLLSDLTLGRTFSGLIRAFANSTNNISFQSVYIGTLAGEVVGLVTDVLTLNSTFVSKASLQALLQETLSQYSAYTALQISSAQLSENLNISPVYSVTILRAGSGFVRSFTIAINDQRSITIEPLIGSIQIKDV